MGMKEISQLKLGPHLISQSNIKNIILLLASCCKKAYSDSILSGGS